METNTRSRRKTRVGRVIGNRMDKTATVRVDRLVQHPMLKRIMRRRTQLHVHDENNELSVGDLVRIMETRPLSKTKRWRLLEVIEKAR
ncbi:MAG: 30S ribosomal protein S17 [Nitrospinota bacterium]|jgi:small subunit ribosomal protein S17|nr:30S ribosomal protein S17 [Nitrospinota bacterium]MDP6484814.1 30S ribosomal protein S17 [Nitrospinota bacterium]HJM41813.1 30S ribosomal protein S17 [Nitrospinota bacterium]